MGTAHSASSNAAGEIALCDAAHLSTFDLQFCELDCFSTLLVYAKNGEHWQHVDGRDVFVVCGND